MKHYSDICLHSLSRFGSLGPNKTGTGRAKERRFVSFQTISCSYNYASRELLSFKTSVHKEKCETFTECKNNAISN